MFRYQSTGSVFCQLNEGQVIDEHCVKWNYSAKEIYIYNAIMSGSFVEKPVKFIKRTLWFDSLRKARSSQP